MKKKILVVDDNRIMLKFMSELLRRDGHEVITAQDGYSALNILVSYVPDVLFIDLFMPNIGGDKLCQIIRTMPHLKDCYLVIISAAVAEMEFDYAGVGADYCIAKGPFDKMAQHVLAALQQSDSLLQEDKSKQIVGAEEIHVRQMTKELLSRNRHLETILESIGEGILEVSSGMIVYANAAAGPLFGSSQAELLARNFVNLFKQSDQKRVKDLLRPSTGTDGHIRPDHPITLNGRQLAIKNYAVTGKISNSIVLISDVTRQNCVQFQEQYACKMEAAATLAGRIAKDLQKQLKDVRQKIDAVIQEMDTGRAALEKIKDIKVHTADMDRRFRAPGGINKIGSENSGKPIPRGTETILLVDNAAVCCQIDRLLLEEIGYKVMIAVAGKDALEKYKIRIGKKYNRIDLVIIDSILPDMDVRELCVQLQRINPEVKILVSGERQPDDQVKFALILENDNFIPKPFNIRQVASKIRELLDRTEPGCSD